MLVSPEFLFRVEQDPAGVAPNTAYRISDLELASRLSFFLWSSIPDDELLDLASARRTAASRRCSSGRCGACWPTRGRETLVTNFAVQWLHLRNLDSITPDLRLFPDFDDNLRQAFRQETELFFESVLREDRSVLDLLRADYTFLNERLAKHYGIPHVYGSRFRRVALDDGQRARRAASPGQHSDGDLLRHAHLAGDPRQVDPREHPRHAAAAAAAERAGAEGQHGRGEPLGPRAAGRAPRNPVCASCHKLMDPVGFSLENFDAVGRWRTVGRRRPIDATGGLPDGSKFAGVPGSSRRC